MAVPRPLLLLLAVTSLAGLSAARSRAVHPDHCSHVRCARPLCANPETPRGQCCPSCATSGCRFKGCVQFLAARPVQWKPDGCVTCSCASNRTLCTGLGCPISLGPGGRPADPCPGVAKVTRPDQCCPVCDYGLRKTRCNVVPVGARNVTVLSGGVACQSSAPLHACDKPGFLSQRGVRMKCSSKTSERSLELKDCFPFSKIRYQDVKRCRAVRSPGLEIGCDIFVP